MSNARDFLTLYFNQRRATLEGLGSSYSKNQMAKELGVSHGALSGWMAGTSTIRRATALQIETATRGVIRADWLVQAPPDTGTDEEANRGAGAGSRCQTPTGG